MNAAKKTIITTVVLRDCDVAQLQCCLVETSAHSIMRGVLGVIEGVKTPPRLENDGQLCLIMSTIKSSSTQFVTMVPMGGMKWGRHPRMDEPFHNSHLLCVL